MKCSTMDVYCFVNIRLMLTLRLTFCNHSVKLLFYIYFSYCVEVALCYDFLKKIMVLMVDVKVRIMVRGK